MMTARGRNNTDWEEDHNGSFHDAQYEDEGIQFDYCRLYILNIPKGLSEDGLRTAFSKYGSLVEVHVSKDPLKKYAIVRYETPGEAKLAMTKLNNTDPMKLHISIARKSKAKKDNHSRDNNFSREKNYSRDSMNRSYTNGPAKRNVREDSASVSSKRSNRVVDDLVDCDEMEETLPPIDDDMDPEIKIKGIQLELQRLQVQEQTMMLRQQLFQLEAARKKNLTQTNTSNRCILPDGRIVVRNVNERSLESRDVDGSFAAGAGDSLTIPALQRGASCVVCGAPADSFCSRCGLTPYCSARCQRRDWSERHRACCHNLARLAGKQDTGANTVADTVPDTDVIPQAAPLRQPHSPAANLQRKDDDAMPDLSVPKKPQQNTSNNKQQPATNNRAPRSFNNNNSFYNKGKQGQGDRKPQRQDSGQDENEDWGGKNAKPAAPATPPASQPPPKSQQAPKPQQAPRPASDPQPKEEEAPAPKVAAKAPGSLTDTTPAKGGKKLVPKNYLIELLSVGDTVLLSVEADGTSCRSSRPGLVCLSMHERYEAQYQELCEQYTVDCEADPGTVKPTPGDSFSYLNPSDGGWYRARCLTPTLAALIDSNKVVSITEGDKLKGLPAKYEASPEFCCLLNASGVKVGDNLICKLISATSDGFAVSLSNVETGAAAGEGEVSRWTPRVEYPVPVIVPPAPTVAVPAHIPEVSRPDVVNKSKVVLVDASGFERAFVRPHAAAAQRRFDQTLEEVVMSVRQGNAQPLKEPPTKGQVVIGRFSDGLEYRALVKRTNVKQNKYLLEYIEFGNVEVTPLENIFACPPNLQLSARPTEASMVTLQAKCSSAFTQPAQEYLDALKDNLTELVLTIPSGADSAASGSAVCLAEAANGDSVNRKLEQMCTPDWKKLEEKGADVVELKPMMFSELESLELPAGGCRVDVLDISALPEGSVSACPRDHPHQQHVFTRLTEQMAEYCDSELGKEPYLPKFEELCIARFPPYPQWFRAVLLEQTPGSGTARVCYVDYGNVAEVPVALLRKMLPDFVRSQPALASHLEIRGFPTNATPEQLARAVEHMQINDEGRGTLTLTRCEKQESGLYVVDAPELLRAMKG